ncbi:hypothetical protein FBQ81_08195 [Chloroflexi bacterium CFX6]|nr:hypothetical protein [Chloroflexi bacterium CFX6]
MSVNFTPRPSQQQILRYTGGQDAHSLRLGKADAWRALGSFAQKPGDRVWLPKGFLTQQHAFSTSVFVCWKVGIKGFLFHDHGLIIRTWVL